ncbi:MAG: hypothetical protein RLZZ501_1744 [Pseudomonadota bacterium]
MTVSTPSLTTLCQSVATAIVTRLPGADATPPRSVLGVLTKIVGALVDGLYGAIAKVAANIIYDTASSDYLVRWAGIWGLKRKAPTAASGSVTLTGTSGATLSAGAAMTRSDGLVYTLAADVTLAAGTGSGTVTCASAGAVTNTDAGGTLTLTLPASGISSTVTVGSGGLAGGADIEKVSSLLSRLLTRIQETPQGGSDADFRRWTLAISGPTRAWVYPDWIGTGTIGVTFMCDDRAEPVPLAADVTIVQAAIDAVRPIACNTTVFQPVAVPLNFAIHLNPGSTAIKSAVEAALASLIANKCTPGGTYVVNGVKTAGGLLYLSQIRAAISAAAGEIDYTMTSPSADVQVGRGQITTLGAITWV